MFKVNINREVLTIAIFCLPCSSLSLFFFLAVLFCILLIFYTDFACQVHSVVPGIESELNKY